MIRRLLSNKILEDLPLKKVILILGARQVGKTTLLHQLKDHFPKPILWIDGDEPQVRTELQNVGKEQLKGIIGDHKTVFFDEAQRIPNIGLTLKILYDNFKNIRIAVTGSSAFYLSDKIKESLAGRKIEYHLYPFSFEEVMLTEGLLTVKSKLDNILIFGLYPEIYLNPGYAKKLLTNLIDSYLFKDIFQFEGIRRPELIEKLSQALALQIGREVSYNELSGMLGISKDTVQKYIRLLELSFIIFRLPAFSTNQRKELKRTRKIYFWDLGIRNALIHSWSSPQLRPDFGHIWENFLIAERLKSLEYHQIAAKPFFWRTTGGMEIDYIEQRGDKLLAYEFKWNPKRKARQPKAFLSLYPNAEFSVVTQENFLEFITLQI